MNVRTIEVLSGYRPEERQVLPAHIRPPDSPALRTRLPSPLDVLQSIDEPIMQLWFGGYDLVEDLLPECPQEVL